MQPLDALYLSPHLDDAALSCGGQIAEATRQGRRVLVVTLFAADEPEAPPSDLARALHAAFGLDHGIVAARRAEDEAAMRELGCDSERWTETEGIYRLDPQSGAPLYPTLEALFGSPVPADDPLVETLHRRLADLPPAARVVAPLGVGGHVDHAIVRRAAERQFGPAPLCYYEDYPYVQRPLALWRVLRWRRGWRSAVEPFGAMALEAKLEAIASYDSQVKPLFGDHARLRRKVMMHRRRLGGERLWRRAATSRKERKQA